MVGNKIEDKVTSTASHSNPETASKQIPDSKIYVTKKKREQITDELRLI